MTGVITRVGATDTKLFGLITDQLGDERTFEEPFTHLDDRDRPFAVGEVVRFRTHPRYAGLAFDVAAETPGE